MERRKFIQRVGLGTSAFVLSNSVNAKNYSALFPHNYKISEYSDLISDSGTVLIRLNYSSSDPGVPFPDISKIDLRKGNLKNSKSYTFFKTVPGPAGEKTVCFPGREVVVLLEISEGSGKAEITIPIGSKKHSFTIQEVIDNKDLQFENGADRVLASYLLDNEIGEINPSEFGIKEAGEKFSFAAMADPQGGNPFAHETVQTRMRIHNAFIDESVRLVNELDPKPAFNIVIGDIIDGQGHHEDFRSMNDMLAKVEVPTIYELGNHETKYNSVFTPGYNMDAFGNYFAAQKEFNRMDKMLYSFNLGKWHFIVWPDPLRANFWETHPHYFHWLEQDLEKHKDRPTIFFQHVPMHPIGILPLINYAETVNVKRLLLELLSKHGNVKYVLSGHVHIPMKASVKTSTEINGIRFINLPAAGYRPRAFGEEDFNGGPSQGIAIVDIDGEDIEIRFKTVTNESFTYPKPKVFEAEKYPLWFTNNWELPGNNRLLNGDFQEDLKYWMKRYIYSEDKDPSNICEVQKNEKGEKFLYMFNRSRGYDTPGQDRLPQSINRVCQVIKHTPGTIPLLNLSYWIDPESYLRENLAGGYIWIEGFEKGLKRMNVVYSNDYVHFHLGGNQSQIKICPPVHMEITTSPNRWRNLTLNPFRDFEKHSEEKMIILDKIDTIAINLGVWTINEGYKRQAGAGFRNIKMESRKISEMNTTDSAMDGVEISKKDQKYLWWFGVKHPAGEHQSFVEDLNKYLD